MSISKKIIFTLMLLLSVISVGCSTDKKDKEEQKMLLCKNNSNTIVFDFDKNKNVSSIYYERIIDLNDYYSKLELEEFKTYKHMLPNAISEMIIDCTNEKYSCNSNYNNYIITNKIYVNNKEEARLADLGEYYGVNYDSIKASAELYGELSCDITNKDNKYVISGNETKINIDGNIYNSIEDMNYNVNKPEYYKMYTLAEFDGKKATIEFKENGKCEISLKEFDFEYWNKSYCDKEKHKNIIKLSYIDGNCSYEVSNDYNFEITYDGKYEQGTYCETYNDKSRMQTKDVVHNHLIKIKFDNTYSNFTYLNGNWKNNKIIGIVEYK